MHEEGAVAADRHARPVGSSELRAQHAGDTESHGAEAHRADERTRPPRRAELDQPVVVNADVAHQDRICRQRLVDLVGGALRMDRGCIVDEAGRDERVPLLAPAVDGVEPFRARCDAVSRTTTALELGQHLTQEGAHPPSARATGYCGRSRRIDVDVDELGRRDRERIAGEPGARRAVVEAHAEREQHVGRARGVVGLIGAVAGDEAERERMLGNRWRRCRSPTRPPECAIAPPVAAAPAPAPPYDALPTRITTLGREQKVDGPSPRRRIGAAAAGDVGVPVLRLRRPRRRP